MRALYLPGIELCHYLTTIKLLDQNDANASKQKGLLKLQNHCDKSTC